MCGNLQNHYFTASHSSRVKLCTHGEGEEDAVRNSTQGFYANLASPGPLLAQWIQRSGVPEKSGDLLQFRLPVYQSSAGRISSANYGNPVCLECFILNLKSIVKTGEKTDGG